MPASPRAAASLAAFVLACVLLAAPSPAEAAQAGTGQATTGQAAPGPAEPGQAEQRRTAPAQAAPTQAAPTQAAPAQAVPSQAAPGQAAPDHAMPVNEGVQQPDSIVHAALSGATQRYRHFVLGRAFEPTRLDVRLADGRSLALELPDDEVFEDREARIVDLDQDGRNEVVVVRSSTKTGSALVVLGVKDGALKVLAQGPSTGAPRRWLNPAGIADFDGDGRLDIAYVQQPHALGRLRVFTYTGSGLVEIASLSDTSNHVAGYAQTHLAVVADFNGDGVADLAVPSFNRRAMRFITFRGGARNISVKPLPAPAAFNSKLLKGPGTPAVLAGLAGSQYVVVSP